MRRRKKSNVKFFKNGILSPSAQWFYKLNQKQLDVVFDYLRCFISHSWRVPIPLWLSFLEGSLEATISLGWKTFSCSDNINWGQTDRYSRSFCLKKKKPCFILWTKGKIQNQRKEVIAALQSDKSFTFLKVFLKLLQHEIFVFTVGNEMIIQYWVDVRLNVRCKSM